MTNRVTRLPTPLGGGLASGAFAAAAAAEARVSTGIADDYADSGLFGGKDEEKRMVKNFPAGMCGWKRRKHKGGRTRLGGQKTKKDLLEYTDHCVLVYNTLVNMIQ